MDSTPVSLLDRLTDPRDQAAWARFVDLFAPMLHGWLRRAGAARDEADDVLQDTFLALYRDLPRFDRRGRGAFRAWLHTVLLHRWHDHRRKRPLPAIGLDGAVPAVALLPPGEDEFRAHLCGRALRILQADFPEATWRGFWATVVEGRSVADVASQLGCTPNSLYSARSRILHRLRGELAEFLD